MRAITQRFIVALAGIAFMASCSRPVAYFQPTARENFKSKPAPAVASNEMVQPAAEPQVAEEAVLPVTESAPTVSAEQLAQVNQVKQAVGQVEAYVRNDNKLASNKKLTKRMERLNEMLTTTSDKAVVSANAAPTKKMSLMERTMLKKIDKKIKNHVAPEKTKAMNSNVRLGLIIGLIGLILWLLGGSSVLALIGIIGFVVGLVLILLGVINA